MPRRSNDFQKLIKTIYEQIIPEGGSVTESGMIYDKESGIQREVDILVEYRYAGHDFSFIVECRDRSRNESIEWIDSLVGKTESLNVNKVIAVSSKAFSSSAIRKAQENGIELLTLDKALETDWIHFPIKPGLVIMTDDVFTINDVHYISGGEYHQISELGLDSKVEIEGEILGDLIGLIEYFFKEILGPKIDEYKKENFLEIFKKRADLEKNLLAESEHDWSGVTVLIKSGKRVELSKVKYIVIGNRKSQKLEQEHHVYNEKMISTSSHLDVDGSAINFSIIQDPETKKLHITWKRS